MSEEQRPGASPALIILGVLAGCFVLVALGGVALVAVGGASVYSVRSRVMDMELQAMAEQQTAERARVEAERAAEAAPGRVETPQAVTVGDGRGRSVAVVLDAAGAPTAVVFGLDARVSVEGQRVTWLAADGTATTTTLAGEQVLARRRVAGGSRVDALPTSRVPLAEVLATLRTTDPQALDIPILFDRVSGLAEAGPR